MENCIVFVQNNELKQLIRAEQSRLFLFVIICRYIVAAICFGAIVSLLSLFTVPFLVVIFNTNFF